MRWLAVALLTGCAAGPQLVPATAPNNTHIEISVGEDATHGAQATRTEGAAETRETSRGGVIVTVWVDTHSDASPSTTGNRIANEMPITTRVAVPTGDTP